MKTRLPILTCLATLLLANGSVHAGKNPLLQLEQYRNQGVSQTDPNNGQQLWNSFVNKRGCTSCHGKNLAETGKNINTGKIIQPMALSVNPDRYRDGRKIEKWFLRNCKWTLGRECSVQEKADILTWLSNQ